MVSRLFLADYKAMTSSGVQLAPEDVIRLNALAVKVKLARKPLARLHLPRAVDFRRFSLREPTLAHEIWLEEAQRHVDVSSELAYIAVFAFALSRPAFALPSWIRPQRTIRAIFKFARRRLACLRRDTISDALTFCLAGDDWTVGENPPPPPRRDAPADDPSPALAIIEGLRIRRLPVTLDEAKAMTAADILSLIVRADLRDGEYDRDAAAHDALGDYIRAREEIKARAKSQTKE